MRDELLSEESPPFLGCTHHVPIMKDFEDSTSSTFYIARIITIERPLGGKLAKQVGQT